MKKRKSMVGPEFAKSGLVALGLTGATLIEYTARAVLSTTGSDSVAGVSPLQVIDSAFCFVAVVIPVSAVF